MGCLPASLERRPPFLNKFGDTCSRNILAPHAIATELKNRDVRVHDGHRNQAQHGVICVNMTKCAEHLRSALLAEPALTKYVDALCEHAEALIAGTDNREAMHAQLKICGVRVIGHRHRAAALMGKLKTDCIHMPTLLCRQPLALHPRPPPAHPASQL